MNRPSLTQSTSSNWPAEAVPVEWVQSLFKRMAAFYGSKFADQWGDVDADEMERMWGIELAKLSRAELKTGVDRLASQEWPPSLPQFIKLCRPPMDYETAFYEAAEGMRARERGEMGKWSNPAHYWAAQRVGAFEMRNQTFAVIGNRWKTALDAILSGGPCADIPAPSKALPAPGKAALSREDAARMLGEINEQVRARGGDGLNAERRDHLAWAKRILARVAEGDKEVTALQKRFATEALRNVGQLGAQA